jgi:hypothetical protein
MTLIAAKPNDDSGEITIPRMFGSSSAALELQITEAPGWRCAFVLSADRMMAP